MHTPNKMKRAFFYTQYPITVNPATRHQAYACKPLVKISRGNKDFERQGNAVFLHKVIVTYSVESDLFLRTNTRSERPQPAPLLAQHYLANSNQIRMKSNVDADFTGFEATSEGITVPVVGELISQINTTVPPTRCTLSQQELTTVVGLADAGSHFASTQTIALPGEATYVSRAHTNNQDCPYRLMIFSTRTNPPIQTATIPGEFFELLPTISAYDPTFTQYNAFPIYQSINNNRLQDMCIFDDGYKKLGLEYVNVTIKEYVFETPHEVYWANPGGLSSPTRGGLYLMLASDVNYGYASDPDTNVYLSLQRLNSRWLLSVNVELYYTD